MYFVFIVPNLNGQFRKTVFSNLAKDRYKVAYVVSLQQVTFCELLYYIFKIKRDQHFSGISMGLYPNSQCQSQYSVWLARYFQTLTQPYLIIQTKDFDFISNNALSLSLSYKLNLTRHFKYLVLKYFASMQTFKGAVILRWCYTLNTEIEESNERTMIDKSQKKTSSDIVL